LTNDCLANIFVYLLDALEINTVRNEIVNYPVISSPEPPYHAATNPRLRIEEKLQQIQTYIQRLEYNYTGMQFFDLNLARPICGLMDTARHMYVVSILFSHRLLFSFILSLFVDRSIE
jgi:hypothetical protein